MQTTTQSDVSLQMDKYLKQHGSDLLVKRGELVKGKVLEKRPKQLFIDLGIRGTGIVFGAEYKGSSDTIKHLEVGDDIYGKVVDIDNEDGYIELSIREADRQMGWERAKEVHENDEVIPMKISGYNRGGLVADFHGLQAFMPVSHLAPDKYPRVGSDQEKILEALREIVGETLQVKIITVNQKNNKLIISERSAAEESIKELVDEYEVGQVIEGVVSGVVDFGAFVRFNDNPEIEGLIHLSELDHRLIDDPRSVVSEGEDIRAKIIDIKDSKVSLSLKALKDNPWDSVLDRYKEGEEIMGEITKFNPFGALVRLDEDFQGLIHVSEFGSVEEMQEQLELGGKFPFIIQAIKPAEKRIVLVQEGSETLNRIGSDPAEEARAAREKEDAASADEEKKEESTEDTEAASDEE